MFSINSAMSDNNVPNWARHGTWSENPKRTLRTWGGFGRGRFGRGSSNRHTASWTNGREIYGVWEHNLHLVVARVRVHWMQRARRMSYMPRNSPRLMSGYGEYPERDLTVASRCGEAMEIRLIDSNGVWC